MQGGTVERKPASAEAVERRRQARKARSAWKQGRGMCKPTPTAPRWDGDSQLSDRERAIIREKVEALSAAGKIDPRYMGLRFLELYALHWTPEFGIPKIAGDLRHYSDEEFYGFWEWWTKIGSHNRAEVIVLSRFEL